MDAVKVSVDCSKTSNWNSFHDEFAVAFGFPDFYRKNMNAWIDCMTYFDDSVRTRSHRIPGRTLR
jgi:RNAse (barnase) inhibitor barstar